MNTFKCSILLIYSAHFPVLNVSCSKHFVIIIKPANNTEMNSANNLVQNTVAFLYVNLFIEVCCFQYNTVNLSVLILKWIWANFIQLSFTALK